MTELYCDPFFGAALGIAYIFAKTIETVGRQPNAEARVAKYSSVTSLFAIINILSFGLRFAYHQSPDSTLRSTYCRLDTVLPLVAESLLLAAEYT